MILKIDFNSDEAIYMQLRNQIIMGIATSQICEGDSLPSVRQLADEIGINMHTVNKAYTVLKQEGIIKLDRRRGAVIAIDIDKLQAMEELKKDITIVIVTHNMQQATRIADKTAFFLLGELVEFGNTDDIFTSPKDERTERYITGRFG